VKMPCMIAQINRRKSLRLFIENGMKAQVSFLKQNHGQLKRTQQFKRMCFDISGGGISFIISKMQKQFFRDADKIKKVSLYIEDFEIDAEARVVNLLEIIPNSKNELNYKGWKVCLEFSFIRPEDKKRIDEYVFKYISFEDAI